MTFVSASEGALWAQVVKDMVTTIKKLGRATSRRRSAWPKQATAASAGEDLAEIAKASAGKKLEAAPVQKK